MVDAILTNTLLPTLSGEFLTRMMEGRSAAGVHIGVEGGAFVYDFNETPALGGSS
jgi:type VI secretion system protein VasG